MSVSKRVRFEVLRRDQNACQYCGGIAPDVALTIDHVVPVALGGSDDPSNLVAACSDCNAGKASTKPDGPFVEAISAAAATFSLDLRAALNQENEAIRLENDFYADVLTLWNKIVRPCNYGRAELPEDGRASIARWRQMGVGLDTFNYAMTAAAAKQGIAAYKRFPYMAGVIWNIIRKAEDAAKAEAPTEVDEVAYSEEYETGWNDCLANVRFRTHQRDWVAAVIDTRPNLSFNYSIKRGALKAPLTVAEVLAGDIGHYARAVSA